MKVLSILVLALLSSITCGGSHGGAGDNDGGNGDGDGDGTPDFEPVAAELRIIETTPIDGSTGIYSTINARFASSAPLNVHTEVDRQGSCRLLTYDASPRCNPPCLNGLCTDTNRCEPFPARLTAGTITLSGLANDQTLFPDSLGNYFFDSTAKLFSPATTVTASIAGGDIDGFSQTLRAPSATSHLVIDGAGLGFPNFKRNTDFEFTWSNPDTSARVRLFMAADNAHGQPSAAIIECDSPDTGSLTVPAALLNEFIDPQNWTCGDCPTHRLTRYRSTTVSLSNGEKFKFVIGNDVHFFYSRWN